MIAMEDNINTGKLIIDKPGRARWPRDFNTWLEGISKTVVVLLAGWDLWMFFLMPVDDCVGSSGNHIILPIFLTMFGNANMGIHEAGHFIMQGFPNVIHYSAGTLFQMLVPTCFAVFFYFKKQFFSASLMLMWLAQNFKEASIYAMTAVNLNDFTAVIINPALYGGSLNNVDTSNVPGDWEFVLDYFHILDQAGRVQAIVWWIGIIVLIIACLCSLYSAWIPYKEKREEF
jgi:hypothetical protein